MKLFLIRMFVGVVFVFTFIVSTFISTNVFMRCVDNMFNEKGIAFTYATNFSFILAMVFGGVCAFGIVKVLRLSRSIEQAMFTHSKNTIKSRRKRFK